MEKQEKNTASPYELDGRPPLKVAIPLGLQHVLAMFVGNLTPLLIITAACGIEAGGDLQVALLQNAMLIAGIVTLVQVFTIGPVGGKLPIVMGTSSGFIGVCQSVAGVMGNGVVAYGSIMAACFIGGLFETVLGSFLKPLRKFFPSVVTGTVVLSIGLSLIGVGISSFGGGSSAKDYGSLENLFVGFVVLIVIIVLKHGTKGFTSFSSILIGIIVGYILVSIMAMVLPTTFTYVDDTGATVEATKAWVLNWDKVAQAKWFAVPALMPVKWVFDARAIVPILIMFIVTAVETVGDISGITEGGLGREATDKELSGGVMCDGLGSSFAALFGVLPNTSFSQNVGLVAMNKVVNRFCIATGGIFLIACGLFPKLAALISIMPQSVLGGAAVMMFSSIVVSGIQLITKWPIGPRNVTIVSVALGLGYGLGSNTAILVHLPQAISLIFGGSGIVPAAGFAIILNIVLPKDEKTDVERAEEMLEKVKNLCSHDKGRTFQVIRESLEELDYEIFYKVLDGQNYVPQHRERILIVGFDRERYGDKIDFEFNLTPRVPKPVMRDILDEEVADKYTLSDKLWTYLQNYAAKHRAAGNGFGYGIAPLDGVSRTLSARYYKDGSEVLIAQEGKNPRRLTPRECARLQGFPDTFKIPVSDTQAYKQFGNSVVVPLMGEVAKLIVNNIETIDNEKEQDIQRKVI